MEDTMLWAELAIRCNLPRDMDVWTILREDYERLQRQDHRAEYPLGDALI